MLYFNSSLFNRLSSIWGETQDDFSMLVFGSKHKYKHRILVPERLLVTDIIDICNRLNMSFANFFSLTPSTMSSDEKEDYVIECTEFYQISVLCCNFCKIFGRNGLANRRLTQAELSDFLGITRVTYHTWYTQPTNFRISHLLTLCNGLGVPLSKLIDDKNTDLTVFDPKDESFYQQEILSEIKKITNNTNSNQKDLMRLQQKLTRRKNDLPFDNNKLCEEDFGATYPASDMEALKSKCDFLEGKTNQLQKEIDELKSLIREYVEGKR